MSVARPPIWGMPNGTTQGVASIIATVKLVNDQCLWSPRVPMSLEPSLVNDQCLWSPRVDSCANVFGALVWTQQNYCAGKLCSLELSLEASFSDQAYPLFVCHDLVVEVLSARTTQVAC